MKCPHCGQEHDDAAKFCQNTGKPIEIQTLVCSNPMCDYRKPLQFNAKFCPLCGTPLDLDNNRTSSCKNEYHNSRIIIAYKRVDEEEDGDDDSYKHVTIFKNDKENILYSGVVSHDTTFLTLKEIKVHLNNKTVINLRAGFNSYIEVSAQGCKTDLTGDRISYGNYHGRKDCNGFDIVDCKESYRYRSLASRKLYDDIYGDFLINSFDEGDVTYFDVFDRYTEDILHSHLPAKFGGVVDEENKEFKDWLPLYNDDLILLINRYSHFCLDENEVIVENVMYDPTWQTGYRIWFYCCDNRILTTFPYDEYNPNYEGIKIIRMRDENGTIIKEIDAEGLFLKNNFKYNRCLAIKTKKSKKVVVFIDENGNIHEIPNTKVHGEPEDVDCFFVTENVLVVNDEDGAVMLNTKGDEIFECYRMRELDGSLVEFFDLDNNCCGVIDATGSIIIPAEYEAFDVLV